MTLQTPRSFNSWLRGQLKEKKMSQRQLALQSGVDHSTISRLIKGDRMPSLGTATKLARGLREIREERRPGSHYAQLDNCRHEVREAENLMQQHRIPMLDTTSKSIEEIATTILHRAKLARHIF